MLRMSYWDFENRLSIEKATPHQVNVGNKIITTPEKLRFLVAG